MDGWKSDAVVHRDESKRDESVRIVFYPDQVEVHSPGLLLPSITVEQMERGDVQSKLRNPVTRWIIKRYPWIHGALGEWHSVYAR